MRIVKAHRAGDRKSRPIAVFVTHANTDVWDEKERLAFHKIATRFLEDELRLESRVREEDKSGGPLRESILDMISRSDYHIILLTPASLSRPWVIFEFAAGLCHLGCCLKESPIKDDDRPGRVILVVEKNKNYSNGDEDEAEALAVYQNFLWISWTAKDRPRNEKKLGRKKTQSVWKQRFADDPEFRHNIQRKLLQDTFKGQNADALGHEPDKPEGTFSWRDYETWLETFSAWTSANVFALSRERLKYWLLEGGEYRAMLRHRIANRLTVERLTLWSGTEDLVDDWTKQNEADKVLWETVGRQGWPRYGCSLCRTHDLLWLFLNDCHDRQEHALYSFQTPACAFQRLHSLQELLIYDEEFVLTAKFTKREEQVEYTLHEGGNEASARSVKAFMKEIRQGTYGSFMQKINVGRNIWTFPACGTISSLINELLHFHNKIYNGCSFSLNTPPRWKKKPRSGSDLRSRV